MKIALFSRSIYPRRGGSSFVVENLASNFNRRELLVVGECDLFSFGRSYVRSNDGPRFFYLPSGLAIGGRGARFFDILRALLFPYILVRSLLIVRRNGCSYVVVVFPEGYYLLLGFLTAKILGLRVSAYFHNTYVENRKGWRRWIAGKMQDKIFNYSDYVFVMSDGMKALFERNYPDIQKFRPLVHTFNTYPESNDITRKSDVRHCEIHFAFTGNFNHSNIDATVRLIDALKTNKRHKLNFYTPVPKVLLKARGVDVSAINYHGYINEEDYLDALQENHFLVLTHGFTGQLSQEEYDTIFPTRTIPMLLARRPIIAHVPPSSFIGKFLECNGCALVIGTSSLTLIADQIADFVNQPEAQATIVSNAVRTAEMFYGPTVKASLVKLLTEKLATDC